MQEYAKHNCSMALIYFNLRSNWKKKTSDHIQKPRLEIRKSLEESLRGGKLVKNLENILNSAISRRILSTEAEG